MNKVVRIDIDRPGTLINDTWREVIPECKYNRVLQKAVCANGKLVTFYMENAADRVSVYDFNSTHL